MRRAPAHSLFLVALLLLPACGPKALKTGSRPFPADRPVFADASGRPLAALPDAPEPVRLVLLDFPWCPACGNVWKALALSSVQVGPGSARIFRILFERETALTETKRRDVPPLHPPGTRGDGGAGGPGGFPVTALTALPGPFLEEFRVGQVPVLLLLGPDGSVARRWIGYSPGMAAEVSGEIRNRAPVPSRLPPGR